MIVAYNNGTPVEKGCTLLPASDGLYNLKTAEGNYLLEPYEDILYAGGGQFVFTEIWGSNCYKGLIDMWGEVGICLITVD